MLATNWHEHSATYDEYKYLMFITEKLWTNLREIILATMVQCLNLLGVNGHFDQILSFYKSGPHQTINCYEK